MDNKIKITWDQETHYIKVCTQFEEFNLIHEAMNAEQDHSYVTLKLIRQGRKSESHPGLHESQKCKSGNTLKATTVTNLKTISQ